MGVNAIAMCLLAALGGNPSLIAYPSQANYSAVVDPYNLDVSAVPSVVTFPTSAKQVAAVVDCAVQSGYKVQPKSGGHSYGNYGSTTGEVSVNLKYINHFSNDDSTNIATVGSGLLLSNTTELMFAAGERYIPHGTCLGVGIGGHATVGGAGPSSRLVGLTVDHITEVEVVTANSKIVHASNTQNPDLFFAIRGAGAGFGIVTEYKFKTEPSPKEAVNYIYSWNATEPATRAQIFSSWQKWISNSSLPREVSSTLTVNPAIVLMAGVYMGPKADFEALSIPSFFPPISNTVADVYTNFLELNELWGAEIQQSGIADPSYFYAKSLGFLPKTMIPEKTIKSLFHYLATAPSDAQFWALNFEVGLGAISDVKPSDTAMVHRDELFFMLSYARTAGKVSATTVHFLDGLNTLAKSGNPNEYYGEYAGYVDPREENAIARQNYWGTNLPRLRQIKAKYDARDVFHNQQSVVPAGK